MIRLLGFSEFFKDFTEYYGMVNSLLFSRTLLSRLKQREICLGFGHKYNIFSYLLLRRKPASVI